MSVESTTLDRSALERKARDELAIIAQSLGLKPRSRDRKADIVQAILDKTGLESGGRAAAGNGGSNGNGHTSPSSDQRDQGGAPVSQHSSDPSDPASGGEGAGSDKQLSLDASPSKPPTEPQAAEAKTEPQGDGSNGKAEASPQPAEQQATETTAKADDTKPSESQAESQGGDKGQQDTKSQDSRSQDNRQGQGRQGQRQRSQGQRNGQKQQGDIEQGNRRRRRRGRNRGGEATPPEEYTGEPVEVEGLLDLRDEGYGFLRVRSTRQSKDDIYVSVKQAKQVGLRKGDHVKGASRPALRGEKNPALLRIDQINGKDPEQVRKRRKFEDLTPLFPDEKLRLEVEVEGGDMTARIIDLISPIGKGQRGLIVSPPKAGKTTIMKHIVRSIEINNPEVKLLVLLVDERPEEVTDMRRWLRNPESEVVASTFDRPADEHMQVAEMSIERAKRLVEDGRDVCIVLDGITRLARAYNLGAPATGRIMSGGVDSGALYPPKKFFGAARNMEEGGSLTILATALIETGSKMDEVIFEEFKGTGNMELRLDRRLAERRIYPAIDVDASSTRHEELLFQRAQLNLVWALRRVLSGLSSTDGGNAAALELLIDRMKTFRTNDEFLAEVSKNRLAAG